MSTLILITGAPGSGKTTLAHRLAEKLHYEFVDSDAVLENLWQSNKNNPQYDREKVGIPKLLTLINEKLQNDKNVITDIILYDYHKTDVAKLMQTARVINLHCHTANAMERFSRREAAPNGETPDWLDADHLQEVSEQTGTPLKIADLQLIEVDTADTYRPTLDAIIAQVQS